MRSSSPTTSTPGAMRCSTGQAGWSIAWSPAISATIALSRTCWRASGRPWSSLASRSRSSTSTPIRCASDSIRDMIIARSAGSRRAAAAEELRVAAHRRERRAQLVPGVGDEPAQPVLRRAPLLERRLDLGQHRVQRRAQAADLGGGVAGVDAAREVAGRDGGGRVLDPHERPQLDPHERPRHGAGDGDDDEADHELEPVEPGDRRARRPPSRSRSRACPRGAGCCWAPPGAADGPTLETRRATCCRVGSDRSR